MDPYKAIRNVLLITLGLNLTVAAAKVSYGLLTQSLSMVADGFHSFFDGTSNVVGLLGIWMASHPPDTDHPYGHKKYEALASLGISLLLFLTCYHILSHAWVRFADSLVPEVTFWSYGVILATIAVNTFTVNFERRKAAELKSAILHHDAMHTRSDLRASFSVLASLAAVQMGFPLLDPVAALGIALLIGRTGFEILLESTRVLSDASMIRPDMIQEVAMGVKGVREIHAVRTRGTTSHVYVDLHLLVPSGMEIQEAHRLAHEVEKRIKEEFHEVTDVVVHVEPEPTVKVRTKS